jgi:hypothetical protein
MVGKSARILNHLGATRADSGSYRWESNLVTIANVSQLEADMKIIAVVRESNKSTNTFGMQNVGTSKSIAGAIRNISDLWVSGEHVARKENIRVHKMLVWKPGMKRNTRGPYASGRIILKRILK